MEDEEKVLYNAIAAVVKNKRKALNKAFTIFCYENDIPTTTLGCIENARRRVQLCKILKVVEALGLQYDEFFSLVKKELPENFKLNKLY